jgi:hypothetical protein
MRWVRMHNILLSGTDFWRYLDKAYNSVSGSGGSNPLHAIPCVHGFTDLTVLSDAPVRVGLPEGQRQLVYVFSASVLVPCVTTHLSILA